MNNTRYINYEESEDAIRWFWEVVNEFTETEKAKLLQFVTGTSRVPLGGFANLRGAFDDPKFTIRRWTFDVSELPVGHTCINTFDLPAYPEKEILKNKILYAINEGSEHNEFID
jgi:E3 ubiquitin-protein ligase HUWE1